MGDNAMDEDGPAGQSESDEALAAEPPDIVALLGSLEEALDVGPRPSEPDEAEANQ